MERTLDKPLKARESDAQFATEVRSHFKSMGKADRLKYLRDAIESNDLITSISVLGAPFYLSGLSETEHTAYLRLLREAQFPEEVQQLTATQAGMDLIVKRSDLVRTEFERAIGAKWHEIERIRNSNPDITRSVKSA